MELELPSGNYYSIQHLCFWVKQQAWAEFWAVKDFIDVFTKGVVPVYASVQAKGLRENQGRPGLSRSILLNDVSFPWAYTQDLGSVVQ